MKLLRLAVQSLSIMRLMYWHICAALKAKDMFIDWGAISGWGMGYKVEEKCWSPEQLKLLGIEASMMLRLSNRGILSDI